MVVKTRFISQLSFNEALSGHKWINCGRSKTGRVMDRGRLKRVRFRYITFKFVSKQVISSCFSVFLPGRFLVLSC